MPKNQRKYREIFLEDGRLPISNNLCEPNIKPYATARRAWLFADEPKGVINSSAFIVVRILLVGYNNFTIEMSGAGDYEMG